MTDVPQLFIVRYKRNVTEESEKTEGKPKSIWDTLQDQELDPASQLVAKYNGSDEIPEVCDYNSRFCELFTLYNALPHMARHTPLF